jgi:hypothetical protein
MCARRSFSVGSTKVVPEHTSVNVIISRPECPPSPPLQNFMLLTPHPGAFEPLVQPHGSIATPTHSHFHSHSYSHLLTCPSQTTAAPSWDATANFDLLEEKAVEKAAVGDEEEK